VESTPTPRDAARAMDAMRATEYGAMRVDADVEAATAREGRDARGRARALGLGAFVLMGVVASVGRRGAREGDATYEGNLGAYEGNLGTARFELDLRCIDEKYKKRHAAFFNAVDPQWNHGTPGIRSAAVVHHDYPFASAAVPMTDWFSWDTGIEMTPFADGSARFYVETDRVNWEYGFAIKNAIGEVLYEIGSDREPAKVFSTKIHKNNTSVRGGTGCFRKYGSYFNRVRTSDASRANPSYSFGRCEETCPPRALGCEHSTVPVNCPSGQVISVVSASYGRQDTTTCNFDYAYPDALLDTTCRAANSLVPTVNECHGRQSCAPTVSNGAMFGDPCYGTIKYLEIFYKCDETEHPRPVEETNDPW
jgi:hypothetical protein